MSKSKSKQVQKKSTSTWMAGIVMLLALIAVVLLGLLAVSILERRWEAQRPSMVLKPIAEWEPNNAVWGENYPREYESYLNTKIDDTRTEYGGGFPRDYLEEDPRQVILFAGYGFSKDYLQSRGHHYAVEDVTKSQRIKSPYMAGTCMTCKSTDVPRLMDSMGVEEFYAANFHDLKKDVTHPIGCQDCHDPKTMKLRITRPALREAFADMGRDINEATHQEMRSLVCAQCHVEYYFAKDPKNYLTFPWTEGTTAEDMITYYDEHDVADYVHPISKVRVVKAQHPDWELFLTGVHAYGGLSCADCHMPYKSEGGVKFTDHHVQSPLLNVANSCAVCHRWEEDKLIARVRTIQDKVQHATWQTEDALVKAHFDVAAAMQAGAGDEQLAEARQLIRHAQFQWDYVSASNGMGFHSPQESMRLLGESLNKAQESRLLLSRILASKGVSGFPVYPDTSTRVRAQKVVDIFTGQGEETLSLLP